MMLDIDITTGINFNVIIFFSVFFISIIGTKLVILSLRNRITAPDIALITGKRKPSIPKNGGIAMIFAIIMGFMAIDTDYSIIGLIFFLTGIPLLSGLMPIPQGAKIIIRVIVVAIAVLLIPGPIFSEILPPLLDHTLGGLLWLWIIHSFDRLEVVEGLIPIEMISIGAGIGLLCLLSDDFFSQLSIQSLIYASGAIGFLWWNMHPAKVMAGEIGRVPAGFIGGYLLLSANSQGYETAALVIPAYFLADSFVTFFKRPFSEKYVSIENMEALKPKTPYCLKAIKNSFAPKWILRTIAGINMLLIYLEAQTMLSPYMLLFNLFLAYAMVFTLVWHFASKNNNV